ncbi:hypothetical protein PVL29_022790 [Vitis rotundifolia]|uniref:Uncharacterized protein n=1 Tax=Vitis rotundifolia TaxID=103349 RepID=A0AA38YWW9_VITRO|nr:hypothetical protein PVL29_022790 [Vitis rotundifolia]
MLCKMAASFLKLVELNLSQSISRSFYPDVTDSNLKVIANGFRCLRLLGLQHCRGWDRVGHRGVGLIWGDFFYLAKNFKNSGISH